jgi:hypothetical protein
MNYTKRFQYLVSYCYVFFNVKIKELGLVWTGATVAKDNSEGEGEGEGGTVG